MLLAEQLVGEARERRASRMNVRERRVVATSAILFAAAAAAIAIFVPTERSADPVIIVLLVLAYAGVSRVRFEFGAIYVGPEQLVFVPMLLLVPLPYVPLLVALGGLIGMLPDLFGGSWARDRWLNPLADSWPVLAPVLVLAALAPGTAGLDQADIYLLALAAQFAADFGHGLLRNVLLDRVPLPALAEDFWGIFRVDAILSPLGFVAALVAVGRPLALFAILGPLVWLFDYFSKDRQERYAAVLELNRAYRGTVMLLSDVIEFDDRYTAQHSRSVVDVVNAVADELGFEKRKRQELEFAAMLHDVGKITIPKEILNKPAKLSDEEFELIKTHTIEGHFMLDRIGGLLGRVGEIVRSCHERWDGGGYPDGLAGEEIPLEARIVFTCDAYNAMTTDRPYRAAMPKADALKELAVNAGTQFDAQIVAALAKVVEEGEPVLTTADQVRALLATRPVPERVGTAA
jgi:HD-GYP domain-containing protein (c-di-GMP phosphodiesterase class II)